MVFCSECGAEIQDGDMFCGECGARSEPIEPDPPSIDGGDPDAQSTTSKGRDPDAPSTTSFTATPTPTTGYVSGVTQEEEISKEEERLLRSMSRKRTPVVMKNKPTPQTTTYQTYVYIYI